MDIGFVQELYKVEAARSRGEAISEFKIARLYVDSMWIEMTEMLESGVPKNDVVGMLMITARVGRPAAYNTITNKLNSAANRKRKVKNEVSKESGGEKQTARPAAAPAPTPAPVVAPAPFVRKPASVEPAKPVAAPAPTPTPPTSASAELQQEQSEVKPDKWAHLRKENIIGKGFLGEESKWMSPEEIGADKQRRAAIERASIISAELSKKTNEQK